MDKTERDSRRSLLRRSSEERRKTLEEADNALIEAVMQELLTTLPAADQEIYCQERRIRELGTRLEVSVEYHEPDDMKRIRLDLRARAIELIVYQHGVMPTAWRHDPTRRGQVLQGRSRCPRRSGSDD